MTRRPHRNGNGPAVCETARPSIQGQLCGEHGWQSKGLIMNYSLAGVGSPKQSPQEDTHPCPQCGAIDRPALGPGSGPHHASARCRHCGAFLRWLSQYTPGDTARPGASRPASWP